MWTSNDGLDWTATSLDAATNATTDVLASGVQGWPAIGTTGSPGCPGSGPVAWNSTDGLGWSQMATDGLDPGDEIADLVAVGGSQFVASGEIADGGDSMGIWAVSVDSAGSEWQSAASPPPSIRGSTLTSLASNTNVVVGFDVTRNPHAWFSSDNGQTWASSDFRAPYGFLISDAVFGPGGFIAAGTACCGLPEQRFGVVIRSVDGQLWTEARTGTAFARPIEAVIASDVGWIALGEETYLSSDGADWRLGPPLPGYDARVHVVNGVPVPYLLAAAVVGDHVVAITPTGVWRASLDDLAADRWAESAPEAEMPVVGASYEATLATHCGPFNGPLYFDKRGWLPDLPDGYFPPTFDYYYETGTLEFVAADRLEFTGSKGDVVVYLPSDDPPHGAPCH